MADATIYARTLGSDSNTGLSVSQAVRTIAKAAQLADGYAAIDPGTRIVVDLDGYFFIPSGGTGSEVLFDSAQTCDDLEIRLGNNTWDVYGTIFALTGSGYQTNTLSIPSGLTIEAVEVDFEMSDPSHVTSDGRRKLYLKYVNSAMLCQSTAGSFYHTGTTLHVNSTLASGNIAVRYRPGSDVIMFKMNGQNLRLIGSGPTTCGILYPMYVQVGIACYGVEFNATPTRHTNYVVRGVRMDGCWHHIGLLSTGSGGSLEFDGLSITQCEFNSEVVSEITTTSYNPIVVYSGNTTGSGGSPVYCDISRWTVESCTFNCYRPVYHDGTSFSNTADVFGTAIGGGTGGNNAAQLMYSHGGNAFCLPRITSGRMAYRNTINIWDYRVTDPHFAQRTYQTLSYTPHTDSAWGSWMEECSMNRKLTYAGGYAGLDYGKVTYSSDCHIRWKRCTYRCPDLAVHSLGTGVGFFPIIATLGTGCVVEWEESIYSIEGLSQATFHRLIQFTNAGSGTPAFIFHARNCTIASAATTLSESIVLFDGNGTLTAKIRCYSCIFHSNDATNTTYWVFAYDISTTQVPLYSTDPAYLVCQNNWYSRMGRFDVSGTQRDTAAEWAANSGDGPHDGGLGNGAGRDALYTSAGTWSDTTLSFGTTDAGRTSKIDPSVTLAYAPTNGINGRSFVRNRGASQYPSVVPAASMLVRAMSAAVGGPTDYDDDEDED